MSSLSDRLDDFPDRFSPMLVKELRQGLRAKTFVVVFLVMQGLLGLILLAATASGSSSRGGEVISQIVFVLFSLVVLVIQPLRGVAALSSEIRGDTIDLMVLTRLSSLRIVLGKWVAIVSQSALLASTIIPYLILRYYFGKMNLFAELMMVAMIFLISAGLTAVTVGLSGCRSVLVRGILPILGAIGLVFSIFGLGFNHRDFSRIIDAFAFQDNDAISFVLLVATLAIYLGWSALSLGASLIAPHAENHATLRRLIALALTAIAMGIATMTSIDQDALPVIWFLFAAPTIGIALSEPNQLVPSVCRSFTRRGVVGRLAGRLLYPGWPSAIGYSLLMVLIGVIFTPFRNGASSINDASIAFMAFVGSLLLPGLLIIWAGNRIKDRTASYILFWIAQFFIALVVVAMADSMAGKEFLWAFVWNPLTLIPMESMSGFKNDDLLVAGIAVNIVYFTILAVFSIMAFRGIRTLENKSPDA